jgi:hypothetical protein
MKYVLKKQLSGVLVNTPLSTWFEAHPGQNLTMSTLAASANKILS